MITKTKSVYIAIIFSILFISTSNARTVKAEIVSGGEEHSMVLDQYGRVWTCGGSTLGRVGDYRKFYPVLKGEQSSDSNYLENIYGIGAGWQHSLTVGIDGSVWSYGDNAYGELGNNNAPTDSDYPVRVHAGQQNPSSPNSNLCNITQVASGRSRKYSYLKS